ncbi:MAG TPA: alpha/beta hydrolase-fold protein [Streptosporangiaceae bacterium]|nr:alpha/beta hydrolase-fold protein [Streptosporangiaceae bacterium]
MGLTSGLLLWLLITSAAGVIGCTVWLWPRLARQSVAPITARLGLIMLAQVLAIAATLASLNDSLAFFGSWSALLGTGAPAQVATSSSAASQVARQAAVQPIQITGSSIGTVFRGGSALPWDRARLASWPAGGPAGRGPRPAGASTAADQGAVLRVTIRGQYTGITGSGDYVYLPPQYFQPAYAAARFPVVLAFTGYPNETINLMKLLTLPAIAARLTAQGRVSPAIYVMVNPSVALPRDTECTNIPAGLQVATYFGRDVPLAVERTFRTQSGRSGWATIGYSTGAYCAAKLAMLFPAQFSAAVSLSGYYVASRDRTTGDLYGGSQAYRNENNLDCRLRHLPAPPVRILVASSDSGEKNLPGTIAFLSLIHPPMRGYSLILRQGGHNYFTWRRELPQSLEWLSSELSPARRLVRILPAHG